MTDHGAGAPAGLIASLGRLASTLTEIAQTRLELLSADLDADREHLLALLLLALTALFCLGLGVLLATILVVATFWDTHRVLALGLLSGGFLCASLVAWRVAAARVRHKPRLFAGSLAELARDRAELTRP